jgi:hypothetical protein
MGSATSYAVSYAVKADCPWHEAPPPVEAADDLGHASPLGAAWERGTSRLGSLDALDLSRETVDAGGAPLHSISPGSPLLERSAAELGLPRWDVLWARKGADQLGIVLAADGPAVLGEEGR